MQGVKKTRLNNELRSVMLRRMSVLNRPEFPDFTSFDVKTFLRYIDFEEEALSNIQLIFIFTVYP